MESENDLLLAGLCTGNLRVRAPFEQAAEENAPSVTAQAAAELRSQITRRPGGDDIIIEPIARSNGD